MNANDPPLTDAEIAKLKRESKNRVYLPDGWVLNDFVNDDSKVAGATGPIGSGKTAAVCARVMRHIVEALPNRDGVRDSKWLVTRNTYGSLKTTTLRTWLYWCGHLGEMKGDKPVHFFLEYGDARAELIFMALEDIYDIEKVRSLELTGAWINENQYFDFELFGEIDSRTGRYPPKDEIRHNFPEGTDDDDIKLQWKGTLFDQNAPPEGHWTWLMFHPETRPPTFTHDDEIKFAKHEGWELFEQPPAVLETFDPATGRFTGFEVNEGQRPGQARAENLKNHSGGPQYYRDMMAGRSRTWIDTNLRNIPGALRHGEPVYRDFARSHHVALEELKARPDASIVVGLDPGQKRCGAVFLQVMRGQVLVLSEMILEGVFADEFGEEIHRHAATYYPDHYHARRWKFWGDPFGERPSSAASREAPTAWAILEKSHGIKVGVPRAANFRRGDIDVRKDALGALLLRTAPGLAGAPALLIDPRCKMLISGLQGGYHWKEKRSGGEFELPKVEKNEYSEVVEALEYAVVGEGLGAGLIGQDQSGFEVHDGRMRRDAVMPRRRDRLAARAERARRGR